MPENELEHYFMFFYAPGGYTTNPLPQQEEAPEPRRTVIKREESGPDTIHPGEDGVNIDFDPTKYKMIDEQSDKNNRRLRVIPRR